MVQVNPDNTSSVKTTEWVYRSWRERFVLPLLVGVLIFGTVALIPAIRAAESPLIDGIFITTYIMVVIATAFKFPYTIRISTFLFGVYILGIAELISLGILGDSLFFFLGLVVFATMLLSPRAGTIAVAGGIITLGIMGFLWMGGRFESLNPGATPAKLEDWISAGAALMMFGVVIVYGFRQLESEFSGAQSRISQTLGALREERNNLENRVTERTMQLRRINEVERAVAAILDIDEILPLTAKYIQNEFDFYCTVVYLLDPSRQWVEMREVVGEAGKMIKEKKQRFSVNGRSLIGQVIRSKTGLILLDSGQIRQEYPLFFPYTRSLILVPLVVGDNVLGALEMHSSKESGFFPQDLDAFQNMANGISVSIENARLYQEAQQSIMEMQATQRQYLEGMWNSLASERNLNYALGDTEQPDANSLKIPLALRNQIIGEIVTSSESEWTAEQKNLIESIAAQATLALENARLVEESQFTAAQEKLTNEIIARLWAAPNMDSILQTVVRELGRNLEASEVEIEVSMEGMGNE